MFKKIVTAILLIAGTMALYSFYNQKDNTLTAEEKKSGWTLLFDGKSLDGWRMYQSKAADCWGVKSGEIYCKDNEKDKSALRADLVTKNEYENYELLVDWKIAAGGNWNDLSKQYTMDGNTTNGDTGWFFGIEMLPAEFQDAVAKHKTGEVFSVDVPEKQWYYIVKKTYDDNLKKDMTVLKANGR